MGYPQDKTREKHKHPTFEVQWVRGILGECEFLNILAGEILVLGLSWLLPILAPMGS